jgi:capsular exopolysaccharide synthesis family protein
MDFTQYWTVLWRRKWVILMTASMAVFIAILVVLLTPPRYAASTTLRIATASIGPVLDQRGYDISYSDRLLNTYSKLATSGPVVSELAQKLGLTQIPLIQVTIPANTELMQVTVEGKDPASAANAANTLGQILIDDFKSHYTQSGKTVEQILSDQLAQAQANLDTARKNYQIVLGQSPVSQQQINAASQAVDAAQQTITRLQTSYQQQLLQDAGQGNTISVADPAAPPLFPSKPNIPLNMGLGLAIGLIGGVGLAFFFENMDSTLFSSEQIVQATQMSPMGWVPKVNGRRQGPLFKEHSPEAEAMRRLRTNLVQNDHSLPPATVLVTSAESGEGKSTLAANLARSFAQSGRGVMLVDADLRMPVLHRIFNLSNSQGLSSVLERKASPNDVMQYTRIPGIWVIPSGPVPANPAELLGSVEMKMLLQQLVERFDLVVLDTPPFLPVADAAVLAPGVQQVLLIVARTIAHRQAVQAAREQLQEMHVRSLGVVVNRAERDEHYSYYSYRPMSMAK